METIKSGWKTSEFWVTIAAILVGLYTPLSSASAAATGAGWAESIGVVAAIVSACAYTISRGLAKRKG